MIMKQCQKCKQEKPLDAFNNNKREKDGKQRSCCECTKIEHKRWYDENKETQLIKNEELRKKKVERFKEYKRQQKCSKCGDSRYYVLDFHHLDSTKKEGTIGEMVSKSQKKLYEELKKCIPLCRNCHTEFHYFEKHNGLTIEQYLN